MTRLSTKQFILSGVLAATTFSVAFVLGSGVILATGIPATGGIVNIFACVVLMTVGSRLAPVFGFVTLTTALVFTFAIPTLIGGPAGIHKILIGVIIGVVFDGVVSLGRRRLGAYILAGALGASVSILSVFVSLVLLRLPGAERLRPLLLPLTAVQAVLGALAAWVGVRIFDRRLKHLSAVRRLMITQETDGGSDA